MTQKPRQPGSAPEFDNEEGLSLALSYLEDPSDVTCPRCGPNTVEVVGFARALESGSLQPAPPEDDYTVVLFCHGCRRAAALELNREAA